MSRTHYFSLQPSETAIFQAAANIYASYVQVGQVTSENSAEVIRTSVGASISLAQCVEKAVRSDEEMPL